ncbi:MAG: hypothetical protein COS94_05200 [Candidatus Hydrogenedentes bacterium CG07_land_8_20_14_0_80_42_17]|nr:MAG: hypothetical protein COS94_05200 [Candidatus Hydrogenedentes bacterium CG07_land_8_20_14_0_80_42_17]
MKHSNNVFAAFLFILLFSSESYADKILVKVSLGEMNSAVMSSSSFRRVELNYRSRLPWISSALPDGFIFLNGRKYRGKIEIRRSAGRKVKAINTLELEDYLRGVVPSEMPSKWPIEALKAQTVVSRSYVLWRIQRENGFSSGQTLVTATVSDQVYRGASAETDTSNLAVDSTKGEILWFGGGIVPAYFHASCGGITERASNVWPHTAERLSNDSAWTLSNTYLFSPKVDLDCIASSHNSWRMTVAPNRLALLLRKKLGSLIAIDSVEISERDESGRALRFRVIGHNSRNVSVTRDIDGNEFRLIVGANKLKSLLCEIGRENNQFYFQGKGWGHGVGLCQWGARAMAERGFNYRQIIEKYYPGVELRTDGAD